MISSIDKITPVAKLDPAEESGRASVIDESLGSFGSVFQSAIDAVKETDAEKTQLQYQLSVGELDNPALLTIAATKNQIAVDLLVQLRNKALDAYSELTRMSI